MNSFQLLEGLGEIEDRFLLEAENYQRPSSRRPATILRWVSAAACLAIALTGGWLYWRQSSLQLGSSNTAADQAASSAAAAPEQYQEAASSENNLAATPFSAKVANDGILYVTEMAAYSPVSDLETLSRNNLPETIPAEAVGPVIQTLEDGSEICAYLPLENVPAVRILHSAEGVNTFLLYQGQADTLSLGELYGFAASEDVVSIQVENRILSDSEKDSVSSLLATLTPDTEEMPTEESESFQQITICLKNGLSFSLSYLEESASILLYDLYYPLSEPLAPLLEPQE
ncbi:MAG: hypothetical protein ACOX6P_09200 [Candidatus Merdivicinus sp.]|jgi:hypothetical protein